MLSVWLGRVVPKRAGIWETIPDLQDLQEIDAMLEERAAEWKDEYIQQGVLIGEARGRAEGEAWGEAKGLGLALRDLLEFRFGTLPMSVTSRIADFSDATALRKLTLSAYQAESLQAFMEQLQKKTGSRSKKGGKPEKRQ